MSPDDNLFAYRGRGRPGSRSTQLSVSAFLKKELRDLRKKMTYKKGAEILLAVSTASDEMVRAVHMFPEVFYMDTTAKTNRQNRDLFLMVVKNRTGKTHIANVTVVPSLRKWVFLKIYQHFFVELYGTATISRNRLALTDNDPSEHGPFDTCKETMDCYRRSKHMLCVFHGVILKYNENVHPLLPRTRSSAERDVPSRQRKLTARASLFGKSREAFTSCVFIPVLGFTWIERMLCNVLENPPSACLLYLRTTPN